MNKEQEFKKLKQKVSAYIDKNVVYELDKAWEFTCLAHFGQKRRSGEDYCMHPLRVALILSEWQLDLETIIAGLLHDTIEDGGVKREELVQLFGGRIAFLVDGVTKVSEIRLAKSSEERFVENLRKMFIFMAKDVRVVLVKLADRLHNMRTLSALPHEKQIRISRETLEVYSPLAERVGMDNAKGELDDLCFPYLYPKEYKRIKKISEKYYKKADKLMLSIHDKIVRRLKQEGLSAQVYSRKKRLYSLWKKMERREINWDPDKVFDILAFRVLVSKTSDCYVALGLVHHLYKPLRQLGITDYIAMPKDNGYQSIHTKLVSKEGQIFEVQIRTFDMHAHAENGIAAHWAYSSQKEKAKSSEKLDSSVSKVDAKNLTWLKQLVEWQNEIKDSKEYLEAVKLDALKERNFIFSPKGDVFDLPQGATAVDFAYAVHTELPCYMRAALADGKIVPLNYELKSGETVEILKNKVKHKPKREWLEFVVTTAARQHIKKELRKDI